MANEQDAKNKLKLLASRAKGQSISLTEDVRIDNAIRAKRIANRADVKRTLEESLGKNASEIQQVLNSHDDSDRLIDEIVDALSD